MEVKDHFEHIFDLAYPFQGQPRMASWLVGCLIQSQELEELFLQIIQLRSIETADYTRLVQIAGLEGLIVDTTDLEELRIKVQAQVWINVSNGSRPDTLRVLRTLMPGATFRWMEFDGGVEVEVAGVAAQDWYQVMAQKAYGSGLLLRLIFVTPDDFFAFGGGAGWGEPFGEIV